VLETRAKPAKRADSRAGSFPPGESAEMNFRFHSKRRFRGTSRLEAPARLQNSVRNRRNWAARASIRLRFSITPT
jgi:hypothetical protein